MKEKRPEDAGYFIWFVVTLLPDLLDDLGMNHFEPYWDFIRKCLGEVLNNDKKFRELKKILGLDGK